MAFVAADAYKYLSSFLQADKLPKLLHVIGLCKIESHPFLSNSKLIEFSQRNGVQVTAYSPVGNPTRHWHVFLYFFVNLVKTTTLPSLQQNHNLFNVI